MEGDESSKVKILFKIGKVGASECHWIVEVDSNLRKSISVLGKISLNWKMCKVKDYKVPMKCGKCHEYGHSGKFCTKEDLCLHCCKPGHKKKDCPQRQEQAFCRNCANLRKKTDHSVTSRDCTAYRLAVEKLERETEYG
jgi:hypothetical protein